MGIAELLARAKPAERQVHLVLDSSLQAKIDELYVQLAMAKRREEVNPQGLASEVPQLEQKIKQLELDAADTGQTFIMRAIPRAKLQEIKRRHPPTDEQWEQYRKEAEASPFTAQAPTFDWLGLGPELIAACCVDPAMTFEEASQLWDVLSDGQAGSLFQAAWSVNQEVTGRPLSASVTELIGSTGLNSTTPQNGESLSPSLADES